MQQALGVQQFFWVCLGGALGAGLRHLLNLSIPLLLGNSFPYATLSVNLLASFLLGLIMVLSLDTHWLSPTTHLTLTTGLLGGLSTYSSFNHETLSLLRQGHWSSAGLNVVLMLNLCLLAGLMGLRLGQWLEQGWG